MDVNLIPHDSAKDKIQKYRDDLNKAEQKIDALKEKIAASLAADTGEIEAVRQILDIISILYLLEFDLLPRTKSQPQIV